MTGRLRSGVTATAAVTALSLTSPASAAFDKQPSAAGAFTAANLALSANPTTGTCTSGTVSVSWGLNTQPSQWPASQSSGVSYTVLTQTSGTPAGTLPSPNPKTVTGGAATTTITGLSNGRSYTFQVQAKFQNWTSPALTSAVRTC